MDTSIEPNAPAAPLQKSRRGLKPAIRTRFEQLAPDSTGQLVVPRKPKGPGRESTQFKPGAEWRGNARGRPKGVKNEINREFLLAVQAEWMKHGKAAIAKMRTRNPARFVEMVARLLPKEHSVDEDQADGFLEVLVALGRASRSRES
jgi:hypothetical protein